MSLKPSARRVRAAEYCTWSIPTSRNVASPTLATDPTKPNESSARLSKTGITGSHQVSASDVRTSTVNSLIISNEVTLTTGKRFHELELQHLLYRAEVYRHSGLTYDLTGPQTLTQVDVADILTRISGKSTTYIPIPRATFEETMRGYGMPGAAATVFIQGRRQRNLHESPIGNLCEGIEKCHLLHFFHLAAGLGLCGVVTENLNSPNDRSVSAVQWLYSHDDRNPAALLVA